MKRAVLLIGFLLAHMGSATAQEIFPTAEDVHPILIGSEIPNASVRTLEGKSIGLHEAIGDKPTVLIFYRGGWCPFCTRQLADLRHTVEPLRKLGVQIIGISGDSPEPADETMTTGEINFTILADFELNAAKAFGLAFHVSDEYVKKLAQYGLNTKGNSVDSQQALPVPAVFVIGSDKIIEFSYVNPNYSVRCDADVLMAAAAAVVKKQ